MIKRLAAFLVFFNCAASFAQTIKTDVLVIGGSPSGVAAAIQCARSKVKTILVEKGHNLCPYLEDATTVTINADKDLPSGIWGEFRQRVRALDKIADTAAMAYNMPLKLKLSTGAAILNGIADTVKNLSLDTNTTFNDIKRDDDRWDVTLLQDGKKLLVKARVVIDATESGMVLQKAGATSQPYNGYESESSENYYRTSVAAGNVAPPAKTETDFAGYNYPKYPNYCIPVKAFIAKGATNLLITEKLFSLNGDMQYLPAQLTLGQGAGVVAAYLAFFKTTNANLNVRMIQGELQDFKGYMLPFADIAHDAYWRAIQQICATGLLKGVQNKVGNDWQLDFVPDSIVTTAEIKPVMLEIYTRAFIWFNKEKPGAQFTLGNLMSFISELTLTDPDNLEKSISKAWTDQFHFTSSFDLDRPITRREFAILANKYLNPFGRAVDVDGKIVN